ncbi:hydroxymethylbilane synthase [Helicobacter brantae]|uniref:Porphobilinogen deaminase n=1 Tax=Helicobacter brantae TaxID=375927 RepID=A0A3D8J198_9HELI|nr:hydroxymethylbilane synthase [Helicobacter brantae]RDU70986.1 hydroxymethylbilane synthase [Helicobacter brantae]
MRKVIIGSRGSMLALWQANYIAKRLQEECNLSSEIKIIKTKGDKILDVPLAKIGGKGLFTKELEEMLLGGEIDLAVHSLKDVPVEFPQGLKLIAITQREDVRDCFLSHHYESLQSLPVGAKVGTTSLRRTMQIKLKRADLDTQSLRGNVQTRLERLKNGDFDAIILAQAGVNRLGIEGVKYMRALSVEEMIPAMGQGALGLECREDSEFAPLFARLNDENTGLFCESEREFIRCLEGGCQVPIGIHASLQDDKLKLQARLGMPDGSKVLEDSILGDRNNHLALAQEFAKRFIDRGAKEILQEASRVAFA